MAFIPDYAAYLTNRLLKGNDRKVPYERLKVKSPTVLGIEFGEKVLFKKKRGDRKNEFLPARCDFGIFLGARAKSNEILVCTLDGLEYARGIHRLNDMSRRWGPDNTEWVKWAPWDSYSGDLRADGDVPEGVPVDETERRDSAGETVYIDVSEKVPRDFRITQRDIHRIGRLEDATGLTVYSSVWEYSHIVEGVANDLRRFYVTARELGTP